MAKNVSRITLVVIILVIIALLFFVTRFMGIDIFSSDKKVEGLDPSYPSCVKTMIKNIINDANTKKYTDVKDCLNSLIDFINYYQSKKYTCKKINDFAGGNGTFSDLHDLALLINPSSISSSNKSNYNSILTYSGRLTNCAISPTAPNSTISEFKKLS